MPCAAPCSRLPCNQRCSRRLSCTHQCPGICGEECPEGYCQICSNRKDARVDLLEMKTYREIDLDNTPIVVLGCGHFFTAETLDGHVGMTEVYDQDEYGEFTGVRDVSATLARSVPRCPDCQCPVRQHCAKRFNRVINRAVIDEMSKRFLVKGQADLRDVERQVVELERDLDNSREDIFEEIRQRPVDHTGQTAHAFAFAANITQRLKERHTKATKIEKDIRSFLNKVADKHQPAQKLHDATVNAVRRRPIDEMMTDLNIADSILPIARDRRITLGGRLAQIQAESITITDRLRISRVLKSPTSAHTTSVRIPGGAPDQTANSFFRTCNALIDDCTTNSLPKLSVEATLHYASTARSYASYRSATTTTSSKNDKNHVSSHVETAKALLESAKDACTLGFHNAINLREAVEGYLKSLAENVSWYEDVSGEEIAAIKKAMLSGAGGLATHSGHWYNCANGHPFAIGDCGMPMEEARCPECGARVGGRGHRAVEGVTRAVEMEG